MSSDPGVRSPESAVESFVCLNCRSLNQHRYCSRCGQRRIPEGDLRLGHAWHHVVFALHVGSFAFALSLVLGWVRARWAIELLLLTRLAYFVGAARRAYGGSWPALIAKGTILQAAEVFFVLLGVSIAVAWTIAS